MAAYNFQKQFIEPIRAGVKCSTIRARRKNGYLPRPGDVLSLYSGMRTKACTLIRKVAVEAVVPVSIQVLPADRGWLEISLVVCGEPVTGGDKHRFAVGEGFKDPEAMAEFFLRMYGENMNGWLIRWNPAVAVQ